MRFKRILVLAFVLTICTVPVAVNAQPSPDDVSIVPLAQSGTTTTDTMGDGMNDNMTTTTTDEMGTETMAEDMTDDQMTDNMTDDTMNDGESGGSGNSLPGFGVGVALVALVAGALFIARNR